MERVEDLTDAELQAELQRTHSAYAAYVRDVGQHPQSAAQELPPDARRHLDAREEIDRRAATRGQPDMLRTPGVHFASGG